MVTLAGWSRANDRSHPGIVATGTMALLTKKKMNTGRIDADEALSGSLVASPIVA